MSFIQLDRSVAYKDLLNDRDALNIVSEYCAVSGVDTGDTWVNFVAVSLLPRMTRELEGAEIIQRLKMAGFSKSDIARVLAVKLRKKEFAIEVNEVTKPQLIKAYLSSNAGKAFLITFFIYLAINIYAVFFSQELEAWLIAYAALYAFISMAVIFPLFYIAISYFSLRPLANRSTSGLNT